MHTDGIYPGAAILTEKTAKKVIVEAGQSAAADKCRRVAYMHASDCFPGRRRVLGCIWCRRPETSQVRLVPNFEPHAFSQETTSSRLGIISVGCNRTAGNRWIGVCRLPS